MAFPNSLSSSSNPQGADFQWSQGLPLASSSFSDLQAELTRTATAIRNLEASLSEWSKQIAENGGSQNTETESDRLYKGLQTICATQLRNKIVTAAMPQLLEEALDQLDQYPVLSIADVAKSMVDLLNPLKPEDVSSQDDNKGALPETAKKVKEAVENRLKTLTKQQTDLTIRLNALQNTVMPLAPVQSSHLIPTPSSSSLPSGALRIPQTVFHEEMPAEFDNEIFASEPLLLLFGSGAEASAASSAAHPPAVGLSSSNVMVQPSAFARKRAAQDEEIFDRDFQPLATPFPNPSDSGAEAAAASSAPNVHIDLSNPDQEESSALSEPNSRKKARVAQSSSAARPLSQKKMRQKNYWQGIMSMYCPGTSILTSIGLPKKVQSFDKDRKRICISSGEFFPVHVIVYAAKKDEIILARNETTRDTGYEGSYFLARVLRPPFFRSGKKFEIQVLPIESENQEPVTLSSRGVGFMLPLSNMGKGHEIFRSLVAYQDKSTNRTLYKFKNEAP